MTEHPPPRATEGTTQRFSRIIGAKERRRVRAQRTRFHDLWFGLGMFGVIGWSIAVPAVILTACGVWIDRRYPSPMSWTLMLLACGVALGCLNAWHWIQNEHRIIEREEREARSSKRPSAPRSQEQDKTRP